MSNRHQPTVSAKAWCLAGAARGKGDAGPGSCLGAIQVSWNILDVESTCSQGNFFSWQEESQISRAHHLAGTIQCASNEHSPS